MLCALLLLLGGVAQAAEFETEVIAVIDGDTVLIRRDHRVQKVRLADIDAPEGDQPFGAESQRSLVALVLHKKVQLVTQAVDKYGRLVAHLRVDRLDVNTEQIRRGMAWEYSFHHLDAALIALQAEAHQAMRGLWSLPAPIPPGEWRKQHPHVFPVPQHVDRDALCGNKKRCGEMNSCAEARHYLTVCGVKSLDANGDGVPCEKLCAAAR